MFQAPLADRLKLAVCAFPARLAPPATIGKRTPHMPGKPVILTVDDDSAVLRAIERDLRRRYGQKHRVLAAPSGVKALELLDRLRERQEPIALFLVAHRMPQINGIEFPTPA